MLIIGEFKKGIEKKRKKGIDGLQCTISFSFSVSLKFSLKVVGRKIDS